MNALSNRKLPRSIFLIEDDEDDQLFFSIALSEIEHTVLFPVAKNGQEALATLANMTVLPDFIFMDINMPKMNGIECLKAIKDIPRIKGIPIVMLTSSIIEKSLTLQLGAQAYIKKPHSGKMLRKEIEQIIDLDFVSNGRAGD